MNRCVAEVWTSGFMGRGSQFDKPGIRAKFRGHPWEPADFNIPLTPKEVLKAHGKHRQGCTLALEQFTEAVAVWHPQAWSKTGDLFMAGAFYAVKKPIADVLKRFDLGDGGLVPVPIFEADLQTPIEGEYYFLNFGARKNSFRPDLSERVHKRPNSQWWRLIGEGPVTVDRTALEGADLWIEEELYGEVFMSGELAHALIAAKPKAELVLRRCDVVGDA